MSNENAVRNLIRIDDKANPTLFRALQLLVDDLYKLNEEIFPSVPVKDAEQGGPLDLLSQVQNFTGTAYPDNLRLDWDNLKGAFRYQIKLGHDWETAKPIIVTATDVANVDPVYLNLVYGTYNFIIRAWNMEGALGEPAEAVLVIPQIPAPDFSLEVIVSNVLLRWSVPPSAWRINHFIVYKDGLEIGRVFGTFKLIQEQVGGSYSYSVQAVDIVGNISTMSAVKVADLHDPSEYEFVDELQADYTGIYVRTDDVVIENIRGVIGPTLIHTWEEHFVFFGFTSPQAQVDAGFPFYYQPSYLGDGSYEEVFDFGQVYKDLTVVVDYNKTQLNGTTTVITELSYSEDGVVFTTPIIGISVLADNFQYIKVKWILTNTDDKSTIFLSNLKVMLNVTLTLDSGTEDCLASDVDGTEIFYNKTFIGISSVTATPTVSTQPLYAVVDGITKDSFKVLVFDSSGNRINGEISWKARGVL